MIIIKECLKAGRTRTMWQIPGWAGVDRHGNWYSMPYQWCTAAAECDRNAAQRALVYAIVSLLCVIQQMCVAKGPVKALTGGPDWLQLMN